MREHIRWVHSASKIEYPEPPPFVCLLCDEKNGSFKDRDELYSHIVRHSDQLSKIHKETGSNGKDACGNTTNGLIIVDEKRIKGTKCDIKIIRENKRLLHEWTERN